VEALPLAVTLTGLVPEQADEVTPVRHLIQAEPIPLIDRDHGLNNQFIALGGSYAHQARDDEIVERGMIVIPAPFLVAFQPIACHLVEVFADIGTPSVVLRFHVLFQKPKIQGIGDIFTIVGVKNNGHGG